jgi:hypothetical protein
MELRSVLLIKVVIEIVLIAVIARKAKEAFGKGWPLAISYLFIAGIGISALDSVLIIFYPESTITKWSTIGQMIRGASIIGIWEIVASMSFLHFMKADNSKIASIVERIYSKRGVILIGIYSLAAILLMIIIGIGFYEMGFTSHVQNVERVSAGWRQLLVDLPAKLWVFPLGLLLAASRQKHSIHWRLGIYSFVAATTIFILVSTWTYGARGVLATVTIFFFVLFISLGYKKRTLAIFALAIFIALVFLTPTQYFRLEQDLSKLSTVERVDILRTYQKRSNMWESITQSIEYVVYRYAPAEPGIFAEWVEENSAYAGITPLIGSALGLVPRAIWPDKPATRSASSSDYDKPEHITGRIMGTPHITKSQSPATNSFWIAWYPGVVIFAVLAGWLAALVLRIGQIELNLGLLLFTIALNWGGTFLLMDPAEMITMLVQAVIPAIIVLIVAKLLLKGTKQADKFNPN